MKMIEVFGLMAKGKIKGGTKLKIYDNSSIYIYKYLEIYKLFLDEEYRRLEQDFEFDGEFLNLEVELIEPEEKKYLVKFNMRGLRNGREYLNLDYDKRGNEHVRLNDKCETLSMQTKFTEQELKSIRSVKEFLEDMQGKYELIEVEDNEID